METFFFSFAVFGLAICGLAVGVVAGRKPIKGSCGGLACLDGVECGACKVGRFREDGS